MSTDRQEAGSGTPSVVIPAHNEERVIERLLCGLVATSARGDLDIVVVCNGCTDGTARRAEAFQPAIRVFSLEAASKHEALRFGDGVTTGYPRIFIDADVEISRESVDRLVQAVNEPGVLAAGPSRRLLAAEAGVLVRSYYAVWERLPSVRAGLFGRGVIVLSEAGHLRIREFPPMLGDDLVVSEAFSESERRVVGGAFVEIRIPRSLGDLYRRKVRVATGNAQAASAGLRRADSGTSVAELVRLLVSEPRLLPRAPVFLGVTLAGRLGARRAVAARDFQTWERDESSRR